MTERVDLEELTRWLATEPRDGDELWCARCRESYSLGDNGDDGTVFCDNCAHLVCEGTLPALIAELTELRAQAGGWVAVRDSLPDSDVWVLVCGPEADYVVVQLEFTDDSEGHGKPYWAAEGGDLALCNYPHWMPLPNPPEATDG